MLLSELNYQSNLKFNIIQNGDFNQLGMLTSNFEKNGVLAFISSEKFLPYLVENLNVSCIIVTDEIYNLNKGLLEKYGIIVNKDPKLLYYNIHNFLAKKSFYWENFDNDINETSIISKSAIISKKNVKIGSNCIIEDNVIISEGVIIEDNVIVRSGSIIGSNGFQFLNTKNEVVPVTSAGQVLIKSNVEIQHNCCVDKGVLGGITTINKDVKIDNFVHIAHDVIIGERTFVTAGVKFGGRTIVGKDCWIGINSTISNGLVIGDNVKISLGSVVTRNVQSNKVVTGNFAIDHNKFIEFIKSIR